MFRHLLNYIATPAMNPMLGISSASTAWSLGRKFAIPSVFIASILMGQLRASQEKSMLKDRYPENWRDQDALARAFMHT